MLDMMIQNMTTYAEIPPMTVTQDVKVEKPDDTLRWENDGQVYYKNLVTINGGKQWCRIINGYYEAGLSVSSPGVIWLEDITIPEGSSLIVNADQAIMLSRCTIQGAIQCVGGNPGVIVDWMTLCNSSAQTIPVLTTVCQPLTFANSSTSQTIQLPSCPLAILLYGFYQPNNLSTPIITLGWNHGKDKGWSVVDYDTTLLTACTITDPHTLQVTFTSTDVTGLVHHFL